ncbi:hypothetical protein BZZ01_00155 [Nostocales cyanobacterium HT-58-2]|nr:hypothetical protein BZZ01_00155 [Nostocales cyanobacterium HT-58-2]
MQLKIENTANLKLPLLEIFEIEQKYTKGYRYRLIDPDQRFEYDLSPTFSDPLYCKSVAEMKALKWAADEEETIIGCIDFHSKMILFQNKLGFEFFGFSGGISTYEHCAEPALMDEWYLELRQEGKAEHLLRLHDCDGKLLRDKISTATIITIGDDRPTIISRLYD